MSFTATNWAYDQRCRSGVAKAVLVYLANCADQNGECYPGVLKICSKVQHGEAAVQRAIRHLIEDRQVERERRTTANGKDTSYRYRLPVATVSTPANSRGSNGTEPPPTPPKSQGSGLWEPSWLKGVEIEGATQNNPPEIEGAKGVEIEGETPPKSRGNPSLEPSKEERTVLRTDRAPDARDVMRRPEDIRALLWQEGRSILRNMTGQLNGQAGKQIGAFLRAANGDCNAVLDAMQAAQREGPHEPIPFIFAGIKVRTSADLRFRDPAVELAHKRGLLDPEERQRFSAGLTPDFSGFNKEAANG